MTIISEERRAQAVAAAAKAAAESATGQVEVGSVQYKGKRLTLPVAQVPLDHVLLNPRSHRIRAQLQSRPQKDADVVSSDPYGAEAQDLLRELLHATDGFEDIRVSLQRKGQEDAGVITAGGVLINANTRAVALEELGVAYINVMVLPSDATDRELNELELKLQMARDVKQDYSFTSQLLFIEDLIDSGWSIEDLGMNLRSDLPDDNAGRKQAQQYVQGELRLLSLIRDVLTLSDGAATFIRFDDKRQALLEIDSDYEAMKNKRPGDAVRLRDAQLTGMLSGIDYRRLRNVDIELLDRHLPAALQEDSLLGPSSAALLASVDDIGGDDRENDQLEGLDVLDDDTDDLDATAPALPSFRTVLSLISQSDPDGFVTLPLPEGEEGTPVPSSRFVSAIQGVFLTALENRRAAGDQQDEMTAPERYVRDAIRNIESARSTFGEVGTRAGFNREKFEDARDKLDEALEAFATAVDEKLQDVNDA